MEYWDIYDEKKQKTGRTMKRNDWNMKPDEYHLTVLGVLKRPDGRYLITQRKLDKEWGAGWWEVPGGGVNAGEDSRDAVIREIREETGIDVQPEEVEGFKIATLEEVQAFAKEGIFLHYDSMKEVFD